MFEVLTSEHPEVVDRESLRQQMFLASFVENKGSIKKTCAATGVSYVTYAKWRKDPDFQGMLAFAQMSEVDALRARAMELAMEGDKDLLKFMLSAFDPDNFDFKLRAVKQGQELIAKNLETTRLNVSLEQLEKLNAEDPVGNLH